MAEHPIQGLMNVTMDKIRQMADSNTIIGKPIQTEDGTTILPVSKVSLALLPQERILTARMPRTRICLAAGAGVRASTSSPWRSSSSRMAASAPSSCPMAPILWTALDHDPRWWERSALC